MSTPRAEVLGRRARRLELAARRRGPARDPGARAAGRPRRCHAADQPGAIPAVATPVGREPAGRGHCARPPLRPAGTRWPRCRTTSPGDGVRARAGAHGRRDRPARQAHRSMFGAGRRRAVRVRAGCKVHDYGYDLLRYAHAGGQRLTAEARRQLDAMFDRDLHARCQATRPGLARLGCHLLAEGFTAVVSVNSWRQHYGNPTRSRCPAGRSGSPSRSWPRRCCPAWCAAAACPPRRWAAPGARRRHAGRPRPLRRLPARGQHRHGGARSLDDRRRGPLR